MNNRSSTTQTAQTAGYADWPAADEAAADYIATRVAPEFGVSAEVIARRLRAEKIYRQPKHDNENTATKH
ncbi:MAG: hypothetical protein ABSC03_15670 [Verrucomicrobiota bacterium]|jgi:hypothetical protein